jgi:hypothetical protein
MIDSLAMAQRLGVVCRNCKGRIDLGDEYVLQSGKKIPFARASWRKMLTCPHPNCGKTREYDGDDLVLYED